MRAYDYIVVLAVFLSSLLGVGGMFVYMTPKPPIVSGIDTSKDLICGRFSNDHGFLLCRPFDQTAKFFGITIGPDGKPIMQPSSQSLSDTLIVAR
jgi:hypothetical protein